VDSGSTDHTVALAEQHGARVLSHPFTDFASQKNFSMEHATGDWVLSIDADERATPELAKEIKETMERGGEYVYAIPFQTFFFGKRLRFGDAFKDVHIRLFPRMHAQWEQPVHEQIVTDLPCRELKNPILHYTTRNLTHYMAKVAQYVPRELAVMRQKGIRPSLLRAVAVPPARFFQLYFFKLGILDGIAGLQYAILSAYYAFRKHWLYWKSARRQPPGLSS
jgi:glycosyltransferase involved in cell wall biosynthesis